MIIVGFPSTSNRMLLCAPGGFCLFHMIDEKSPIPRRKFRQTLKYRL